MHLAATSRPLALKMQLADVAFESLGHGIISAIPSSLVAKCFPPATPEGAIKPTNSHLRHIQRIGGGLHHLDSLAVVRRADFDDPVQPDEHLAAHAWWQFRKARRVGDQAEAC